ncbi:MAG: flagellar hook assembly protein FlgD [Sphingomonas sp.]|nr:flagellar hook assembly protein FlgD [Sphingomonas sp.]
MQTSFDSTLASLGINRSNAGPQVQTASKLDTLTSSDFIKLLTAQLQNQDPTDPVDATAQLTQLAQFSQVSGLNDINTTLKAIQDQLNAKGSATGTADALSYVGHNVLVAGDTAYPRTTGGIAGSVELGSDATDVRLSIQSPDGTILKSISLGAQARGTASFDWDGITDGGADAGPGPYKVVVAANNAGKAVAAQSLVWAPVTSVSIPATGSPILSLPGLGRISAADVREVG